MKIDIIVPYVWVLGTFIQEKNGHFYKNRMSLIETGEWFWLCRACRFVIKIIYHIGESKIWKHIVRRWVIFTLPYRYFEFNGGFFLTNWETFFRKNVLVIHLGKQIYWHKIIKINLVMGYTCTCKAVFFNVVEIKDSWKYEVAKTKNI